MDIAGLWMILVAFAFTTDVVSGQPLKVFILAGQSNMEGQGEMTSGAQGNLTYLVQNDPEGTFQHLVDNGGNWAVRDDVWIWYKRGGTTIVKGGLSAGYGVNAHCIGPELQFGHVMGELFDNQVLLIKTAWGGKSLAVDFRPPSSGYNKPPVAPGDQGYYYKEMMAIVADVLANLSTHFPAYGGQGYEIAGFGWHQGWNDRVNQSFNDEYEQNMANFIRDVRNDLGIPNLPFVIATTGMSGWDETHARALSLMAAQLAMATDYPEFKDNVAVVETRDFWRPAAESPANQAYHWNRNAETYFLIGNAMGEEMAGLLARKDIRVIDFNGDGNVNFKDFSHLVTYVGVNEPSVDIAPMPFGDDIVDARDVAAFIDYWLTDVLVLAHWKLDETEGSMAHDSVGNRDGTVHGDPNWQPSGGKLGGALELDGVGDYVTTEFVLNPVGGAFSVFAWIKGGSPGQAVISQTDGAGTGRNWLAANSSGGELTTGVRKVGRGAAPLISEFVITDGEWHRIGLVWDGSYRHLYADDEEVAMDSVPWEALESADGGLYFGVGNTLEAASFFSGLIDDIRIYNRAVTP
jgi:hypothetical protein